MFDLTVSVTVVQGCVRVRCEPVSVCGGGQGRRQGREAGGRAHRLRLHHHYVAL